MNKLLDALQWCWEWQVWPSAANVARKMGYKQFKLCSRQNRLRKKLLRKNFDV